MSLLVLGISHRSGDLDLLERLAVPTDERRKVLRQLTGLEHVLEAVIVSTCNRVEVYAHLSRFHDGLDEVAALLADRAGDRAEDFLDHHEMRWDLDVATHLFRVVGGLESMVVGERQIAMQVRDAMELARTEGTAGYMLQRLFRQAVRVGRRLRHETAVSEGASSMVDVALGDLSWRRQDATALIVGAGAIGTLAAKQLTGTAALQVWNRSHDKARRLAERHGGVVVNDLAAGIRDADLIVCTTGAPQPLLTHTQVGDRTQRPLTVIDLAMPRNVDPAVGDLPGVRLMGIEDVRDAAEATLRDDVMASAVELVDEEVAGFQTWLSAREVSPVIRALRGQADQMRRAELARFESRLAHLDDDTRNTVEALTEGIVNTLLHRPTIGIKQRADDGRAQITTEVVRDLFGLDVEPDVQQ